MGSTKAAICVAYPLTSDQYDSCYSTVNLVRYNHSYKQKQKRYQRRPLHVEMRHGSMATSPLEAAAKWIDRFDRLTALRPSKGKLTILSKVEGPMGFPPWS